MFKKIFDRHKLEISIISCGDTGQEIGAKIIDTLKDHGASVKSMAITSELEKHQEHHKFDIRVSIDDKVDGFAKRLDDGIEAAEKHKTEIVEAIKEIIPKEEQGLILLTTGAGATGLGSVLTVIEILYKQFRKSPPILTLLPEAFENSRVQYNISVFLYRVVYQQENFGNAVILLDNKPRLDEMDQPFSEVSKKRIETIPTGLADLLYASFDESLSEEFDATVGDLYNVIHTPGISAFVSEDLGISEDSEDTLDSSRIEDVISDSVISTTSLEKEGIFDAKNAFIALINIETKEDELSFQTEFETRKLFREFRNTNPFVKLIAKGREGTDKKPKLRAIVAGLPLPPRILQIMRLAKDSRKEVMINEREFKNEVLPLDIDRIENLENKLHKKT